jgi:hypothetical protein
MTTGGSKSGEIVLGENLSFPAYGEKSLSSQVVFVTGKRGSGKSWTSGVMMEEMERCDLQFVCFDTLGAHKGLEQLPNVEMITPREDETLDMQGIVDKVANSNKSLVLNLTGCSLPKQQLLIADYCEALIDTKIGHNHGKTLMTVFEECQDYVPQQGKPVSHNAIVRLCKLGRGLGYGCTLVTQRPASCSKEAVSQAAIYLTHNVINSRDLKALEDQLSFGTDKDRIKRILQGVTAAQKGECVAFAPEFFRNSGYIRISKIRGDRRTKHSGGNISAAPVSSISNSENANSAGSSYSPSTGSGSMSYPSNMKPLTSFGTDWSSAENALPNSPTNPYASSDMGADTFKTETEEPPVVWLPPVDYDAPMVVEEMAAEDGSPFGGAGPLVGMVIALGMAAGGFVLIKGLSD